MNKNQDITGQRYKKLTAIRINEEETNKRNNKISVWECLCDCGNTTYVSINNWGKTQSCGCIRTKTSKVKIGDVFNNLTVVSKGEDIIEKDRSSKRGYNIRRSWNCMCSCGTYKEKIREKSLVSGRIKSCGCITYPNKIKSIIQNLNSNEFDLSGEFGVGYDSKGKPFYFDIDDYEKIKEYRWIVKNNGYVESQTRKSIDFQQKCLSLHRYVLNIDDKNVHIDHINHKPNDNRKNNLRIVNRFQNQANSKTRIDNSSGTKGVYYCNTRNRWVATLQENNRQHAKSFKTKEEAIEYRKVLEEKYQKEYSYENSIRRTND